MLARYIVVLCKSHITSELSQNCTESAGSTIVFHGC